MRPVLLEGHVRMTAYALYPEYLPSELEVYLGTSRSNRSLDQLLAPL